MELNTQNKTNTVDIDELKLQLQKQVQKSTIDIENDTTTLSDQMKNLLISLMS
jgi:archaellin